MAFNVAEKYREYAELDADHAFLTVSLLISSAVYEGTTEERMRDLIELQRIHLEHVGKSDLGWALSARYDERGAIE